MTRVAILGKRRDQALIGQPGTAAHQSVQQDDGPPGTDLPPGQFKAIQATEPVHRQIRHEHKVYHGPEAGGYLAQPHPACLLVVGQRGRHGSLRSGHRKRPVSWAVNYRIAVRAQSLIASKNLRGCWYPQTARRQSDCWEPPTRLSRIIRLLSPVRSWSSAPITSARIVSAKMLAPSQRDVR